MSEKTPRPEITPENKDQELGEINPDRIWGIDLKNGEVRADDKEKLSEWHGEQIDRDNK
jgi:hypothetical protein